MASSATKRSLCKTCNKAPSVFFCGGCQNGYCNDHAKEHRQELSRQLETIVVEHDQLKQNLSEFAKKSSNNHPLVKEIDQWERQSINKIRQAADDARKQLINVIGGCSNKITEDLKHLTQELTTARSENNFIELDLNEWMEKLQQLTKESKTPSSINIQQENRSIPFIQKIVVSLKQNEFFERSAGNVKIEDGGKVITSESLGYSTTRCHGDYTSGQHRFRFKIEQLSPNRWMHVGIVLKNIPLQNESYATPTTSGWTINDDRVVCHGRDSATGNQYNNDVKENDTLELFLDCDRRKICLTNERTNNKREIDIGITQCPFPWQVQIGLYRQNDRIRYLPV